MELTAYHPCPCHADRKIKFCCGKQIVDDLNRVVALTAAKQSLTTLETLDRLIAQHGPKDCLRTLKTESLISLGEIEKAKENIADFLRDNPAHPIGLRQRARICLAEYDLPGAVDALQDAMDGIKGNAIPFALVSAFRMVGWALMQTDHPIAGRRHLQFAFTLSPKDEQTAAAVTQSYGLPVASQLLKFDLKLPDAPADREWSKAYQQLRKLIDRGRWRTALQYLDAKLLPQFPGEPALLTTGAILATWLGQRDQAIKRWTEAAGSPNASPDDALDAQLCALALGEDDGSRKLPVHRVSIPLLSLERALERLTSSKLAHRLVVDADDDADGPPPRAVFLLLDRPALPIHESLSDEEIPCGLTQLLVYGRQTDERERIVFATVDGEVKLGIEKSLREILDDTADFGQMESTPFTTVTELQWRLTNSWTSVEPLEAGQSRYWQQREERYFYHEVWPRIPFDVLDQQAPLNVVGNPKYRLALEALVGGLELRDVFIGLDPTTVERLRDKLGLITPAAISPGPDRSFPPTAYRRLRVRWEDASDDRLGQEAAHNIATQFWAGFRRLAPELVRRPSLEGKLAFDSIYRLLASMTPDDDVALNYLRQGRKFVQASGQPVGPWLVGELEFRLEREIDDQFNELLNEIKTRHMHEPGVQARLSRILAELESAAGGGEEAPSDDPGMELGEIAPGEIWTPQSPAPKGSSKLWVPGSD